MATIFFSKLFNVIFIVFFLVVSRTATAPLDRLKVLLQVRKISMTQFLSSYTCRLKHLWKFGRTCKSLGNNCPRLVFPQYFLFSQTYIQNSTTQKKHGKCTYFLSLITIDWRPCTKCLLIQYSIDNTVSLLVGTSIKYKQDRNWIWFCNDGKGGWHQIPVERKWC